MRERTGRKGEGHVISHYNLLTGTLATCEAVEVRMGLNATGVVSVSGRPYLLAGVSHFFDFDGESGRNIRLLSGIAATAPRIPVVVEDQSKNTVFVADP